MSGFRLPTGGRRINRSRSCHFVFNGQHLSGFEGDTLASALLANGISIVGRSFKYHRPRGIVGYGLAETNALVQLGDAGLSTPNVLATDIVLHDGLIARSVNCWPSAAFDLAAVNSLFRPVLTAGFYYKTFMWPSWHLFEHFIRRAAGLGKAPNMVDAEFYDTRLITVDRLIVGGGETGHEAAVPEPGTRIMLIDRGETAEIPGVQVLGRTTAVAHLDHGFVLAIEELPGTPAVGRVRQRLWRIRAGEIVYATGQCEQPLVFVNNDLPGVMLASAVAHYAQDYGVAVGHRILVAADHCADTIAESCRAAGLEVVHAVEGHLLRRAVGRRCVKAAEIETAHGRAAISCDVIAMSGGWAPNAQLFLQAGGKLARDGTSGALIADQAPQNVRFVSRAVSSACASISNGILTDGRLAASAFIDFQTDVTAADVALAVRENYRAADHVKRYTTLGMGIDQGKLSGANGATAIASFSGVPASEILPTKSRPPLMPVAFGALAAGRPAGELWRPRKYLPAHAFHTSLGAVFDDYGWQRPSHYPLGDESLEQAVPREVLAVRQAAGLFDGSPLGKYEVKGPEAAHFLDHVYAGTMSTLGIGKIRYGLMLNENGTIIDDGVCMRLADDHFLINATSAHADRIFSWLDELLQCEWAMDLVLQDVTSAWATFALAGPHAREILNVTGSDVDLSRESFPHLQVRVGHVAGLPARIARVSFSGEVCYEISVAASTANKLGEALMAAGKPFGLVPYGIEALEILRVEKGYIHVGSDTDSETQPADIGFAAMVAKKQINHIGRRSLMRPRSLSPNRKHLVGLRCDDPTIVLPMGAHLVGDGNMSVGFIGSSHMSPTLNHGVALALLERGHQRYGERVIVYSMGKHWSATVCAPQFYDPANERLRG